MFVYEPEFIVDFAGAVAGKTIIDALEQDDIELLSNYEKRIRRLPGKPPGRAWGKTRKWMPVQIMIYCRSI
jgi:hypothetical protein